MSSAIPVSLPSYQIDALIEDLDTFPPKSQRHGWGCVVSGRVGTIEPADKGFTTQILDGELYRVLWTWDGTFWEPDCTCPAAPYCSHTYAAASAVISQLREAWLAANQSTWPTTPDAPRSIPQRAGKTTGDTRPGIVQTLRAAREPWLRFRSFQALIDPLNRYGIDIRSPLFLEILDDSDPDIMCWRLAEALSRLPDIEVPGDLNEYLDRSDLKDRFVERQRTALAMALLSWAGEQRSAAERQLRAVLNFITENDRLWLTIEPRLTSPRVQDKPRTPQQIRQIRSDLNRRPNIFSPEEALLLDWLTDCAQVQTYASGYRYDPNNTRMQLNGLRVRELVSRLAGSPFITWDDEIEPSLARRAGIEPGQIMRASAEPVRIVPVCSGTGGDLFIEFACVWPDGRQRPLDDVVYLRDDHGTRIQLSTILCDGTFFTVTHEPPIRLAERFAQIGRLPLAPAERPTMLSALVAHFPHLENIVTKHTRFYRLEPVAAFDLREDDWLQVRIYARNRTSWTPTDIIGTDDIVFEYDPGGRWVRLTSETQVPAEEVAQVDTPDSTAADPDLAFSQSPPVSKDTQAEENEFWLEAPETAPMEPLLEWMKSLDLRPGTMGRPGGRVPTWGDAHIGWWQKFSRSTVVRFSEAWENRPGGVAYFGTARMRRLLGNGVRVWPKLQVEKSGVDWFSVSAEWAAEGLKLTDEDLAALRNATARFVKISSGWVQRDAAEVHDAAADVLADLGIEAGAGVQQLSVWQLVSAKPENLAALEKFGADAATLDAVRQLRERVQSFEGLPAITLPSELKADLRPYQRHGVEFLAYTASIGAGAILADDMGLGKTVQALAWALHLLREGEGSGPILVVCPASVVHNWEREAQRFTPSLRTLLLTSGKVRHRLRSEIPQHDLVITNYALLRRDVEAWREIPLRAVILDEAQHIKNPDAAVTQAAASLPARYRLALTGTPLENRALDLFSIVDVVNPGYLGRRSRFQLLYDHPDAPRHARTLLAAKLRPILLRRTKREVAPELPERIEERWDCEMTAGQRQLYLSEVRHSRNIIDQFSETPGGIAQNKIHILAALTRLRQICCHPHLAGGVTNLGSGKFDALFELLEPILAEGHKVLVFSQFVECIRLLRTAMKQRGIGHHVLTGQSTRRAAIVDAFQSDPDPCVFLISLKAGGTGLNLTAASYVVLFDPWWNPAVEAQAIDRTHRIGQDRTVIAYRLISRGTIEEKIFHLQQRKAALAQDILGEEGFARSLSREDLAYLLEEA